TDVFGSKALGNGKATPGSLAGGIFLSGAVNNTITSNVISGNGTPSNGPSGGIVAWSNGNPNDPNSGNIIKGNLTGTDATGTPTTGSDGKSLGNSNTGVAFTDMFDVNNVIGGTTPGAGNTIAASTESGVAFWGIGNRILGNAIVHNGQGVWVVGSN